MWQIYEGYYSIIEVWNSAISSNKDRLMVLSELGQAQKDKPWNINLIEEESGAMAIRTKKSGDVGHWRGYLMGTKVQLDSRN